ncbi:MAG: prepilin-type N-terminal cleavage/methylation domain-containing protein [Desulfobacterales bacterium]|nr:prepilin-type N-terminal cleavage/methylation domain-containing protein [Desulfobacterales bacterium]
MIQKLRGSNEKGFTLIELMIVIAIIGILAAIAIPNFVSYRQRSYNAAAQSDMKNMMTAQEAYFVDNETYRTVANTTGSASLPPGGLSLSKSVNLAITGTTTGYSMTAYHTAGNVTWTVAGPGGNMTTAAAS